MLRYPLTVMILLLTMPVCSLAQTLDLSSSGEYVDGIAAVVNDGIVLNSEVSQEMTQIIERLNQQGAQVPPTNILAPQVLERLIIKHIQLQRAERVGLQIPDESLNMALTNIAERNGTTLSELPALLASEGIEYSSFRNQMREQLTIDQLRQRDVIARINITPRELDEYLERRAENADQNNEFELSHILISTPIDATVDNIAAAEDRIRSILERARSGESFFDLAIANSDGQNALAGR